MFEDEDEEDILPERRRVLALQNLDSQRQSIRMIEELLSKCVRSLGTRTTMSKKKQNESEWRAALGEAPVLAGCDIVNRGNIRLLSEHTEGQKLFKCPHLIAVRMAVLLNLQYKRPWPQDEDAIRYHGTKMSIAITKKQ
ncbi:hypothetical protein M3Y98_00279400 [Aphelenchoides besseyi]|nr:hypothetical protein M3Y98_00279400 [Aphelenchoides besseyi]